MDAYFLSPSSFSILFLLTIFQLSYARDDFHFTSCAPFDCGNLVNISYPFWTDQYNRPSYCGYGDEGYKLKCRQNQPPVLTLSSQEFYVLHLNRSYGLLTIKRVELNNTCPQPILINYAFNYTKTAENITLFYDCRSRGGPNHRFSCRKGGKETSLMFFKEDENECTGYSEEVEIPIGKKAFDYLIGGISTVNESLLEPFDIKYLAYDGYCKQCEDSGGRCGSNQNETSTFACYCRDNPHSTECNRGRSSFNLGKKLALGFGGGASSLLITWIIITLYFKRTMPCIRITSFHWKSTKNDTNIEAVIRNNGTLCPKRYSYLDVKKMTNSFKEKLGKGGYGSVYKGKLLDGHLVAVKVLNTTKGNGQEFINEVASISRTSHVNIVTLLGFCLEGQKRALIYEFMPNGSLERFIYKEATMKDCQHLSLEKLFEIAIGIARGLEYLHCGCNTRILHFDIKPHNVLLDDKFFPKIADFGLAKLCTMKESIVSMLEARGTIGYIAPEVFCRNVGGVSHKSDVYSYGMVILEMVGGRKNINVGVSQTSEIYYPHWIYGYVVQGNLSAAPNANSLRGFEVIDSIKSKLETACPGVVSCADILAVAARDSVATLGGPTWTVELGRRDSTTASFSNANTDLASPLMNLDELISVFSKKGFTEKEMVALSGSHTTGKARCLLFRNRIYNETNIDSEFAKSIQSNCPSSGGGDNLSPLDDGSPVIFDNSYFKNLVNNKGLLHSDQALFNGGSMDSQVATYSENPITFYVDFANAMVKMGNLSVLTGTDGEIRTNCRKVN